ncbi:hypothetical protein RhiirA4_531170 [Rhizophagus irregularis]|uniref:Uncharacterized protein n=1 Tax=Rhizophagus irregularis TaxID=588596 RepID=A0A2I1GVT0_9GLOM|nr:hypothetical protein RhiirA4_531170 [Rhizophagus irregularis]
MNIISPREFVNTFYKDIFNLLSKKFTKIGTRRPRVFREEVLQVFRQTDSSIKVFETIAHVTSLPVEEVILLLESSVEVAHKIYVDNTKLQGQTYEILREKANENHSQSREYSNTLSKQAGMIKRQERIISQKNEQIRQISQEAEKTRLELKKVKSGNNKEPDQQKKPKKSRSASNRRKREEILEIPVLPEISSDDQIFKNARDIFFYDIPKYWSEEDVRKNLERLGKIIRIQIRGQFKYKTVKAKIALDENVEKSFIGGHFGICVANHYIRWYDASLGLKGQQERDQWQTVRDLTDEEMDLIKKEGVNEFLENKLEYKSKAAFMKIIKITKNWKVIGYFCNQKAMEEAVEDSCTNGDIKKVWLIRNKKTIYKEEKKRPTKVTEKSRKEESEVTNKENVKSVPKGILNEPITPMTPPDRIYRELGNFASRKESLMHPSKEEGFHQMPPNDDSDSEESVISYREAQAKLRSRKRTPDEQAVVDMINKWRLNDEENSPDQTDTAQKKPEQLPLRKELKKDNVAPEEVVEIIKKHRKEARIKYVPYSPTSASKGAVTDKLDELKSIFDSLDSEMEWEKINNQVISEIADSISLKDLKDMENGSPPSKKNFFQIGRRVINLAEQNDIMRLYTTLNDGFEQRLKDENRYQDKKEIGDKRPIFDSPKKSESSESDSEEDYSDVIEPYIIEPEKDLNLSLNEVTTRVRKIIKV